jgi:hypothetical protein
MPRWRTDDIVKLLSGLPNVASVSSWPPDGDFNTSRITLCAPGQPQHTLFVRGFEPDGEGIKTPGDCDVELVEVTDGERSSGGFNSDHLPTAHIYAEVCCALRKAGFSVVKSMDDYF